jgi:hypothetical protein
MDPQPRSSYSLACWLFLHALAVIYCVAFTSFGFQIEGLIGSHGILPLADYLRAVHNQLGASAYWDMPSIFWLNDSDAMLLAVPVAGVLLSISLLFQPTRRLALILLYALYLSLDSAGQTFLSFQWDALLLEAGFLAIFLSASRPRIWLFRWLLFRLMLLSGSVKLLSGDPAWRSLTALSYHYETQPLPTPIAWYMQQLPAWFQSASVVFVFAAELGLPFLIFAGRRMRMVAAAGFGLLQTLILLTGNYTYFNWLAIALCIPLLDDAIWARVIPSRIADRARVGFPAHTQGRVDRATNVALLVLIGAVSGGQLFETFARVRPRPLTAIQEWIAPLQAVNTYGLFAVMTTTRPEIIVEGSNDGANWLEYEFRYKPGDVKRRPPWVAPHQPRLDWQMWFGALGTYQENPWFVHLVQRLLEGEPKVLALLERNPFPDAPPRFLRARVYQYHFTTWSQRKATGAWWTREPAGEYFPQVSLKR